MRGLLRDRLIVVWLLLIAATCFPRALEELRGVPVPLLQSGDSGIQFYGCAARAARTEDLVARLAGESSLCGRYARGRSRAAAGSNRIGSERRPQMPR
jgi:hypothetical protein